MMERSTLILAPAAAGGGDPHGQEPRRGPRTEPEPGKGPKGPGQGREAAGAAQEPHRGIKPAFRKTVLTGTIKNRKIRVALYLVPVPRCQCRRVSFGRPGTTNLYRHSLKEGQCIKCQSR